jgi:hypothetical protein
MCCTTLQTDEGRARRQTLTAPRPQRQRPIRSPAATARPWWAWRSRKVTSYPGSRYHPLRSALARTSISRYAASHSPTRRPPSRIANATMTPITMSDVRRPASSTEGRTEEAMWSVLRRTSDLLKDYFGRNECAYGMRTVRTTPIWSAIGRRAVAGTSGRCSGARRINTRDGSEVSVQDAKGCFWNGW